MELQNTIHHVRKIIAFTVEKYAVVTFDPSVDIAAGKRDLPPV